MANNTHERGVAAGTAPRCIALVGPFGSGKTSLLEAAHILGTVLVGMAFAAGWSPCIGPILSTILILAASEETVREGVWLLTIYSLGLWIPFLVISLFVDQMLIILKKTKRALNFVNVAAGVLLIGLGLALVLDRFGMLLSLSALPGA